MLEGGQHAFVSDGPPGQQSLGVFVGQEAVLVTQDCHHHIPLEVGQLVLVSQLENVHRIGWSDAGLKGAVTLLSQRRNLVLVPGAEGLGGELAQGGQWPPCLCTGISVPWLAALAQGRSSWPSRPKVGRGEGRRLSLALCQTVLPVCRWTSTLAWPWQFDPAK